MQPFLEKRRNTRVTTAIPIETLGPKRTMVAHDLSTGGMQVTTATPMWPGQLVPVKFRLPGTVDTIGCTCRVSTLTQVPVGVGLCLIFLRLDPEAHRLIASWVARRAIHEAA